MAMDIKYRKKTLIETKSRRVHLVDAELERRIVDYYASGNFTLIEIAHKLKISPYAVCRKLAKYDRLVNENIIENLSSLRKQSLQEYMRLQMAVNNKMEQLAIEEDPRKIALFLKCIEHASKLQARIDVLLGLEAPKRHEVKTQSEFFVATAPQSADTYEEWARQSAAIDAEATIVQEKSQENQQDTEDEL